MKITLNKDYFIKEFVYDYLPLYMYSLLKGCIEDKQIDRLNQSYNFDTRKFLLYSFLNLRISSDESNYYIEIDKNLRLNGLPVHQCIQMITYGNLSTKGYPVVNKLFDMINNNIFIIYKNWKD